MFFCDAERSLVSLEIILGDVVMADPPARTSGRVWLDAVILLYEV